jgi:hypothetical protein
VEPSKVPQDDNSMDIDDEETCPHPYCLVLTAKSHLMRNYQSLLDGFIPASTAQKLKTSKHKDGEYIYTPIKDLLYTTPPTMYNIHGVIIDYTSIRPTKGTDLTRSLLVIDENEKPFNIVLMRRNNLPDIKYTGQIYRAHRMRVEMFNGSLQGQCGAGFDDLVLSNIPDEQIDHKVIENKTFLPSDRERVEQLRTWSQSYLRSKKCATTGGYRKTIAQLWEQISAEGGTVYCDIICKVVNINTSTSTTVVQVWDGSLPNRINANVKIVPHLLSQWISNSNSGVAPNVWIKLRNVSSKKWNNIDPGDDDPDAPRIDIMNIMTADKSSIVVLPDYHYDVQQTIASAISVGSDTRKKSVGNSVRLPPPQKRPPNELQLAPNTTLITNTQFIKAPISTIKQILDSDNKTYKFRCCASVVSHFPKDVREFSRPICPSCNHGLTKQLECKKCSHTVPSQDVKYQYMFQLAITDSSGSKLVAFVYDTDAENLLCDLPASNLFDDSNSTSLIALKRRVDVLMDPKSVMDVCLYANITNGQRVFRVTATWMTHFEK